MLTEGFHYLILTNVIICLLSGYFIDSGQAAAFGEWEGCPVNIATYAGCNVTLKAYFNVKDNNIMCSETFIQFGVIDGNNNIQLKKSVSFGVNGSNDVCEVITVLDNVTPGVREVIFSAVRLVPPDSETLTCDDLLSIKADTLPFNDDNVEISMNNVEANITWPAPSLYAPNDLEGYLVTFQENQSVTYFKIVTLGNAITVTNVTTGSCVQINAIYCGGQYSESILLPLISNEDQEIAAPENVTANLDCNILSIEWSAPSGSLQDHHVDYYTVTISDFNLTLSTKMTSIEVTLNETILSSLYSFEVNVTFTICGWSSKASVTEVDIVPVNFNLVTYRMLVLHESHGSVLLKPEACKGSYTVNAAFTCNDSMNVVNQSSVVNVHEEKDHVPLNYILPLNQTCKGIFTLNQNEKQYTFHMIIKTLSPLRFTTQANNAQFGLQYLCLFKCCDVHYGVSQTPKGGCTSLETNFAVLTEDDSVCDGYFTLRCDNFTVIYNQTTPSETLSISLIETLTSSLLHPIETSYTPTFDLEDQQITFNELSAALLGIAIVLFICLTISIIFHIVVLFKVRKGTSFRVNSFSTEQEQDLSIRFTMNVETANSPTVTINADSNEPVMNPNPTYSVTPRSMITSSIINSKPPALMKADQDDENTYEIMAGFFSSDGISKTQEPTMISHEPHETSNPQSKKIKKSSSDTDLWHRARGNPIPTSRKRFNRTSSINKRQFDTDSDDDTKETDSLISESSTKDLTTDTELTNIIDKYATAKHTMTYLRQMNTIQEVQIPERKVSTTNVPVNDNKDDEYDVDMEYLISFNPIDD